VFWQSQSHGALIFTQVARDDKRAYGMTASPMARRSLGEGGSRHI
jgi:hypothetical protein